ncbi:MAG: DUF11 domain-containing protein [Blautia sp.]|nr:DUF11 domain-containing protein [Blautia sp.]
MKMLMAVIVILTAMGLTGQRYAPVRGEAENLFEAGNLADDSLFLPGAGGQESAFEVFSPPESLSPFGEDQPDAINPDPAWEVFEAGGMEREYASKVSIVSSTDQETTNEAFPDDELDTRALYELLDAAEEAVRDPDAYDRNLWSEGENDTEEDLQTVQQTINGPVLTQPSQEKEGRTVSRGSSGQSEILILDEGQEPPISPPGNATDQQLMLAASQKTGQESNSLFRDRQEAVSYEETDPDNNRSSQNDWGKSDPGDYADFIVTKTADTASAKPGDTVHYTIQIQNTGTVTLHSVVSTEKFLGAGIKAYFEQTEGILLNETRSQALISSIAPGERAVLLAYVVIPAETTSQSLVNQVEVTTRETGTRVKSSEATVPLQATQNRITQTSFSDYTQSATSHPEDTDTSFHITPKTGDSAQTGTLLGMIFLASSSILTCLIVMHTKDR